MQISPVLGIRCFTWSMAVAARDMKGIVKGLIFLLSCTAHGRMLHAYRDDVQQGRYTQQLPPIIIHEGHLPLPLCGHRKGQCFVWQDKRMPSRRPEFAPVEQNLEPFLPLKEK